VIKYSVFIGFVIQMVSAFLYCRAIIKKQATPERTTWLLWATIPFVATVIALRGGAGLAALPVFASGLAPLIVLSVAIILRSGKWSFSVLSIVCLIIAVISLVIEVFGSSFVAALAVLSAEFAATLPTLAKSWKSPRTESVGAYILSFISASTALLAVNRWTIQQASFPILVMILMAAIVLIIVLRRRVSNE